ncbi:catalase, partial [Burkholderia pseudomallei]
AYNYHNPQRGETYEKFHSKSLQRQNNQTAAHAEANQGNDFNHMTRDLIAAIDAARNPKWDLYVQTLKPDQHDQIAFYPLDATKV